MTSIELKLNLHKLIDSINNDKVLIKMYDILSKVEKRTDGALWAFLSPQEQEELILIEKESQNPKNLISNKTMKVKHKKWL